MSDTKIRTYRQHRPREWREQHPNETWRCDIYPADGSDHHGLGETEAVAIYNASLAYMRYMGDSPA